MRRGGVGVHRWWRAITVLVAVAVLAAVPIAIASLPVTNAKVSATTLLQRIRSSASIPFSGLIQSQGNLGLPDLPKTGQTADLLGGIVRMREWWAGPSRWRVDQLSTAGEIDTYPQANGSLIWDSQADQVTRVVGTPAVHEPTAIDLTPPSLGRRLADAAAGSTLARVGAERIAGEAAVGLQITPAAGTTTISHIDIWATPAGLPLQVTVSGAGSKTPVVTTTFLSLNTSVPNRSVTSFTNPRGSLFTATDAPDYVAAASQEPQLQLPSTLGGLPKAPLLGDGSTHTGVGTYAKGYALLAVVPISGDILHQAFDSLRPPIGLTLGTDIPAYIEPLGVFDVVVGIDDLGPPTGYLMIGTIGTAKMKAAAEQISRPFRGQ